jgi:tRNA (adenine22-N1)-methyltransferase
MIDLLQKSIQLSPRLACLERWVSKNARLADVGTDHGYLPVDLLLKGLCQQAIATDIGTGPLQNAKKTAEKYGVQEKMTFVLSDGLQKISPADADTIVIAGMGGETILHILEEAPWVNAPQYTLLLQPMSKIETLRSFLAAQGYEIDQEQLIEEQRFLYHAMRVRGGGEKRETPLEPLFRYGSRALWTSGSPLLNAYCDGVLQRLDRAILGLQKSRQPGAEEQRVQLMEERAAILEKRRELV